MNEMDKKEARKSHNRQLMYQLIGLLINLIILYFLYIYLTELNTNPLLSLLIVTFILLIFAGIIFKGTRRKTLYSRLFPEKNAQIKKRERRKRMKYQIKSDIETSKLKQFDPIDLNFKYNKPLIVKCNNCGMILPSFAKKCPNCGKERSL